MSDLWGVGLMGYRTYGMSDLWGVGLMRCRTYGVSDLWGVGLMVSDLWGVGLMGCRTCEATPYRLVSCLYEKLTNLVTICFPQVQTSFKKWLINY